MIRAPTILIISHEQHSKTLSDHYLLYNIRKQWLDLGYQVEEICGLQKKVQADLAFVHVDLSVVSDDYLDFARDYPRHINAAIKDIRKTVYSRNQITLTDSYDGQVIVKTVLNSGGVAERLLRSQGFHLGSEEVLLTDSTYLMSTKEDYRIFPSITEVPLEYFNNKAFIVEKFIPEMHDGMYLLREWYFLGNASVNNVELSTSPVFASGITAPELALSTPRELYELRKNLRIDYGKIDYVMHEGKPVVFDVNKTTGASPDWKSDGLEVDVKLASLLAQGIQEYLL